MKIGIIDYDITYKPSLKVISPDSAKLCSYYEEKGCQVSILSPEDDIFNYDKIILVANRLFLTRGGKRDKIKHPNIQFIGASFNNGVYIPFEEDEINYRDIDYKFYNNLFKYFYKNNVYTLEDIKKIKQNTFIRLFPKDKPINLDKLMIGQNIYLVDNYIFDKDKWEETTKYMSVFHKYFHFSNSQLISNGEDLTSFKKLVDYNFVGLKGLIRIEDTNEFESFIKENRSLIKEIETKLEWQIGYNKKGNYTEDFYVKDFYNCLQKTKILNEYKINVTYTKFIDNSKFRFTAEVFECLARWMKTETNTKYSFNEIIFSMMKGDKRRSYFSFIQKHPEYNSLINTIYNKEGFDC